MLQSASHAEGGVAPGPPLVCSREAAGKIKDFMQVRYTTQCAWGSVVEGRGGRREGREEGGGGGGMRRRR